MYVCMYCAALNNCSVSKHYQTVLLRGSFDYFTAFLVEKLKCRCNNGTNKCCSIVIWLQK